MAEFAVPCAIRPIRGAFRVPPSKSIAQRALVLAALSDGATDVVADGVDPSDDVVGTAAAIGALSGGSGAPSGPRDGGWRGDALGTSRESVRADLGMNATGFRFVTALACLRPAGARTLVTGRPRLLARPHAPLVKALGTLGAHVRSRASGAVRIVARPWTRHAVSLDGGTSSQYASALLLCAPRAGGLELSIGDAAVSRGYLALTLDALAKFGIGVERSGTSVRVPSGAPSCPRFVVEPDASSAATWWTAAALTGGRVTIPGLFRSTIQPDAAILSVLERMGAKVRDDDVGATVENPGASLVGAGDVDLRDAPDLAPLVAVLAAAADGPTRIVGADHLHHKESDRIASVAAGLRAMGVSVSEATDGFRVDGGIRPTGARIDVHGDHRLVLAFGVLGLAVAGTRLTGASAVSKSYPRFLDELARASGTAESAGPPAAE